MDGAEETSRSSECVGAVLRWHGLREVQPLILYSNNHMNNTLHLKHNVPKRRNSRLFVRTTCSSS